MQAIKVFHVQHVFATPRDLSYFKKNSTKWFLAEGHLEVTSMERKPSVVVDLSFEDIPVVVIDLSFKNVPVVIDLSFENIPVVVVVVVDLSSENVPVVVDLSF